LPLPAREAERLAPAGVHGCRSGRSTFTAALALRDLLQAGYYHIATHDINSFFPSISWDFLRGRLTALFAERLNDKVIKKAYKPLKPPLVAPAKAGAQYGCVSL